MRIVDLIQGSPEWLAHRARHRNAGDAAAMLSCSPHESRNALLRRVYLDMQKDVSDFVQSKVFDPGHLFERRARPIAEKIANEDLYPVVGVLDGTLLSASFDGVPMDESFPWEHKRLNDELLAAFQSIEEGELPRSALPLHHRIQMEHQMIVADAGRALFMASEWTTNGDLVEEHHCWHESDPELRRRIIDGWAQFEKDLADYELPPAAGAAPTGKTPDTLPALRIEVTGAVTASNLAEFKQTALTAIRSVNRDLKTDQDFADAEKAIKWCAEVESRLKAAKEHALSQTKDIDALFKTLDDISTEAKTVRLDLGRLNERRKTEVKEEAVAKARRALDAHIAALNAEIAPFRLPAIAADFAGTIKGLKSVSSMHDKLDGLLATTKIAAEVEARAIRANVAVFKAEADGFEFLFADLGAVIHKAADDFRALVQGRIAQHKVAEAERERKKAEAAELARQQAEARAVEQRRLAEEALRLAAEARRAEEDAAAASAFASLAEARRVGALPADLQGALENLVGSLAAEAAIENASAHFCCDKGRALGLAGRPCPECAEASAAYSAAMAPRPDEPATLKLGDINARLHPLQISAAGLAELGISPARTEGASKLYRESDFGRVLRAIREHIDALQVAA